MAISYEGMGLAAHQFSAQKIPLLQAAVEWFGVCGGVLEEVQGSRDGGSGVLMCEEDDDDPFVEYHRPDYDHDGEDGRKWDEEEILFSGESDNSFDYTNTTISTYSEVSLFDEGGDGIGDGDERGLVPSPLKVRKVSGESVGGSSSLQGSEGEDHAMGTAKAGVRVSLPLPLRIAAPTTSAPIYTGPKKEVGTQTWQSVNTPGYKGELYTHTTIDFLRQQVTSSITTLHKMITDVAEMQYARRMSKGMRRSGSFWSFSPVKEKHVADGDDIGKGKSSLGVKEGTEQRIARLRRDGWQTVGIRGQNSGWKGEGYYRAYCERVLDELYLGRS
ncbi:uncharacterized protein BO88DRAFT_439959 [Aspergillus vadensis CBS 113365]|uniref:Uncharacterized protein n=1 Tax=Aspergillus vadensis (strain CBS 113365 / IMI 142717 / IBT 24658) TaxID=1448311 RepID=A0A319C7S8_ASPVC|nr:hypothetical protein BO88DRAFT_439959 [Aspergillus vadensis CBS 113365]PYH74503.1 hypothetical protein BO88DRAFT_439959 [Aspergillus vadensis CBS 113365]